MGSVQPFEPGHGDRVTALDVNFDGTRLLTGSIDHRIKVWSIDRKTGEKKLIETFTAHDADIRDAKFVKSTVGSYIGTVGTDLAFKLWAEDVTQAYNSGRRFKLIVTIPSKPRIPFTSLDFRVVDDVYLHLALIDRQGLLSIYEPTSPDDFREWTLLDQFHVSSPVPSRGDETSFKLCWDHSVTPLAYASSISEDRNQLGLLVSSINEIKIYQSTTDAEVGSLGQDENGASHRVTFHECFRSHAHPDLVRGIAWAANNTRGSERIATACKDGSIRIFELALVPSEADSTGDPSSTPTQRGERSIARNRPPQQSQLTSAITGRPNVSPSITTRPARSFLFPFTYQIQHASTIPAHGDAWSVKWDSQGKTLMSGGSDGVTKMWKKSIVEGKWMIFAEQKVEDGSDEEEA